MIKFIYSFSLFFFAPLVLNVERCLLYSMKLWGDNLEALRIASGTIYNEVANLPCDCYSIFPFYHS